MDFNLDFGCEEIVANTITKKKVKRINQNKRQSNSKILKHLLHCLSENKHPHMLESSRKKEKEFKVKYINKKSPKWEKRDISLFKEMDDLFPKLRKEASYDEDCKVRFKANMQKLCSSGFLKLEGCKKKSASVTIVTFKILRYSDGDRPVKAKSERKMKNHVKMDRAVVNRESQITASTETSVENGPNMVSLALVPGYNQIEANGNPGLPFNSTYYFKPMQEENEVPTKYNNDIEANGNPGLPFNSTYYFKPMQEENEVPTKYNNDIEVNGNPGLPFNSTYYFKPMQEENEVPTKYNNDIEANGNPGLPFNSTYYFKPMQEENEVPTKYNNDIEVNENPGISFNAEYFQREDVVDNTYVNWNNRIGGELIGEESGGYEEIMIGKDPVLSSTWKKDDVMDGSNFLHSEGDNWMAEFSTSLFE